MKILFINQFFWPDSSATSQQLTDLVTGLVELGNDVSVLCGEGGYAEAASSNAPPVLIYRVKASPFVRSRVGRILSYLSFYAVAVLRGLTLPRYDVVVSLTTPPLISLLGTLIKTFRGSRHFIWEQDIYPDVAIDLNYFKAGGVADHFTGFFADLSRRHADGVIALGECMKNRLIQRGIEPSRITIAENWASGTAIEPMPRHGDPNTLVLLYSGNLGLAHDLDTLTGAIKNLHHDSQFRFLFIGNGGKRKQLADFCTKNEISTVELRPYVSRDRLSESLAAGDIGLVTQHDVCCGSVVPSKVYGILAAGRPILFIGPRAATPALTIERHQCGWQIDCGDVDGLTRLLLHLAHNRHLVHQAGARARQALLDHYDLPASIRRIATIIGNRSDAMPILTPPVGLSPTAAPTTHKLLPLQTPTQLS
jgi:colanic acid biosynthesis glycosyl transferase WcaI